MKKNNTAILFFSRTASSETKQKKFSNRLSAKDRFVVTQKLIDNSLQIAQKTKLPILNLFSDQQIGNSFGEKLANGIQMVFSKGFENVIVIGNDCLKLTAKNIIQSAQKIATDNSIVIGPNKRGGTYLIGVSQQNFNKKEFINLPWQTHNLQEKIKEYASQINQTISWLEFKSDFNSQSDLFNTFKSQTTLNTLLIELIKIVNGILINFIKLKNECSQNVFSTNLELRGPPTNI